MFSLLGGILACGLVLPAVARDVNGKVMAVYLEPVTINNKVMDKVSVSVKNCTSGQWETFAYSPGSVSDDNSLGYLYNHLANAARSVVTKNQFMNSVSGHVTLAVNEQNVIQKTTFWGYNWECGQDVEGKAASNPAGGGSTVNTAPSSATPAHTQPSAPSNPLGKIRKFGF
jgi:hypothetical protein